MSGVFGMLGGDARLQTGSARQTDSQCEMDSLRQWPGIHLPIPTERGLINLTG